MAKRYYWLRLHDDFFDSKRIKKLRRIAGGDTYVIIYLKLQLKAMKTDGLIEYSGLEPTFADELALDLDENPDDVRVTLNYLLATGLAETNNEETFFFPYAVENVGSETAGAQRMREHRERERTKLSQCDELPSLCDKTVTERKRIDREEIEKSKRREDARTRDPFAEFVLNEEDQDLTDAILTWLSEMSDSGAPLTVKDQEEILNKLRTEFPRDEWVPAIQRSTARRWRSVFRRKEDRKTAAAKKQRESWGEAVPAEETERLVRMTKEMELDE